MEPVRSLLFSVAARNDCSLVPPPPQAPPPPPPRPPRVNISSRNDRSRERPRPYRRSGVQNRTVCVTPGSSRVVYVAKSRPARRSDFRTERETFKKTVHASTLKWMRLLDVRLPAVLRKHVEEFDYFYGDYNKLLTIVKDRSTSVGSDHAEIMYYNTVRPTRELLALLESRLVNDDLQGHQRGLAVLAAVADLYNRLVWTRGIVANTFTKTEWTDRQEFLIFNCQHVPTPDELYLDDYWLKIQRTEYVPPFDFVGANVDLKKTRTSKMLQLSTVYVLGHGTPVHIVGLYPDEYVFRNRYVYYTMCKALKAVDPSVFDQAFSYLINVDGHVYDARKIFLHADLCPAGKSPDDPYYLSVVEKFLQLNAFTAETTIRRLYPERTGDIVVTESGRRLNDSDGVPFPEGIVLHAFDHKETCVKNNKVYYYRRPADDFVCSVTVLDDMGRDSPLSSTAQKRPVYFYDTVHVRRYVDTQRELMDPENHRRLVENLSAEIFGRRAPAADVVQNSRCTINRVLTDDVLASAMPPADDFYRGTVRSMADDRVDEIVTQSLVRGQQYSAEDAELLDDIDRGRLRRDYKSEDELTDPEEDEDAAAERRTRNSWRQTPRSAKPEAVVTYTDPTTSNRVSVFVDGRDSDWKDEPVEIGQSGAMYVRTVYVNEPTRGEVTLCADPPQLRMDDSLLRIFCLQYNATENRPNRFVQYPVTCVVFRQQPGVHFTQAYADARHPRPLSYCGSAPSGPVVQTAWCQGDDSAVVAGNVDYTDVGEHQRQTADVEDIEEKDAFSINIFFAQEESVIGAVNLDAGAHAAVAHTAVSEDFTASPPTLTPPPPSSSPRPEAGGETRDNTCVAAGTQPPAKEVDEEEVGKERQPASSDVEAPAGGGFPDLTDVEFGWDEETTGARAGDSNLEVGYGSEPLMTPRPPVVFHDPLAREP